MPYDARMHVVLLGALAFGAFDDAITRAACARGVPLVDVARAHDVASRRCGLYAGAAR